MTALPDTLTERSWYEALDRLQFGTLHFVDPHGKRTIFRGPNPGAEAEFAIADWKVIRNLVARGDVALGEDYIDGHWNTDSIERLFILFLMNIEALDRFAHGTRFHRSILALYNQFVRRNSKRGSKRNIHAHYDVGNAFYELWLDRTMTYSSALFTDPGNTLEAAQTNKYQRILDQFDRDHAQVLEVGCGWGGFAAQAVTQSHHLTGLTISPAQYAFASQRLKGAADIRLQDYRDVNGTFDMIVSIEMFEAVGERYWSDYFRMLAARLKRHGKAIIQTITVRDELFADYRKRSDFIRHHVFPGGMLPSLARFKQEAQAAGLRCAGAYGFGHDYAETLRRWKTRLEQRRAEVHALGHDDAFIRNWQFYLGICAAAFAVERTNVYQIELVHA